MNPLHDAVTELLAEVAAAPNPGTVATYIPELAGADPEAFGVTLTGVRGRSYRAGDTDHAFTVQSVSKPFVYALALSDLGLDGVSRHVGFEPSGEPFNAISLDPDTGRPANPLVNAGAIVTTALVPAAGPEERFERIRRTLSAFAGRPLEVDESVYRSESDTGDRNRALAHLAKAAGVLPGRVDDAVEVYFRQCSVLVTTDDLGVMAATLANAGVNPLTGDTVVAEDVARHTLSVMATCGMYDHSGEWMVRVGLPAKSGVAGGIVAVQPGQFGVGVFSPPLDGFGNSVRGVAILEALSARFGLHVFAHAHRPVSPVASASTRSRVETLALRGEIDVHAAEQVISDVAALVAREAATDPADLPSEVRLDLTAVGRVVPGAERLLAATAGWLRREGVALLAVDPHGVLAGIPGPAGATLVVVSDLTPPGRQD